MKEIFKRALATAAAAVLSVSTLCVYPLDSAQQIESVSAATESEWGLLSIGGGGFVSGLVNGESEVYCRTDVGGAYRLDGDHWVQLMGFLSEADKGFLCVEAMCLDPTDDQIIYLLCGCNYFSDARTAVFRSENGGKTFTSTDVSDLIRVHGNGQGRQQGERIAIDPNNTNVIYAGGRTGGLIKSTDAGKTWAKVTAFDDLGLFDTNLKWPMWTDHYEDTTANENGICTLYVDANSKLYVGVSVTGKTNLYASTDGGKTLKPASDDLPTDKYIGRINPDCDGNLLLSYQGSYSFLGTGGGIFRYNITSGKVTDISPNESSFGQCQTYPGKPDMLVATTCGQFAGPQSWDEESSAWGEYIYVTKDGGENWESIFPGKTGAWEWNPETGESAPKKLYDYFTKTDVDWIYGKAIHWSGSLIVDPKDPSRVLVTSGNGVFEWTDIWTDNPHAAFYADGIEEVVALDLCSVPDGSVFSAIGDYDGFEHTDVKTSKQHVPNMGSTSSIAYCPDNSDVMLRIPENNSNATMGYYSLDAGKTWTELSSSGGFGGDCAIMKLANGKYRFLVGQSNSSAVVNYSDDYGATWKAATGLTGSKRSMLEVDTKNPGYIYAYTNVPSYSGEKTYYYLNVSSDYGATFTSHEVAVNDCCADFRRITVVDGTVYCPVGWYGLYKTSDMGASFEKVESVYYCETIGSGIGKDASSPLALYMWGRLSEDEVNGIYMSDDLGKNWTRVNDDLHEYGGTGNGNFIVGDMNEYGTVYMSTVGVGIVYCKTNGGTPVTPPPVGDTLYGDIYIDGVVNMKDLVLLAKYSAKLETLNKQQLLNADVQYDSAVNLKDVVKLSKKIAKFDVVLGP